jgi:hypothetical protein
MRASDNTSDLLSFDIGSLMSTQHQMMPSNTECQVVTRGGSYRVETTWSGRKVRGPRRATVSEAEQDKLIIEAAKNAGSMDQVLAEWQVNCQVLPKGVYYHKEKKAFVATICITPSRFASVYHGPGRNSKKYDGPARRTAEEALVDREKMAAAKSEEELLEVLKEIRGPTARGEKKTGHPSEIVPQGVYYKPDTGTYQAQVSVARKNVRGPPRATLQEAIFDRQRLLIAKANNQAEQESLELKMEYQRKIAAESGQDLDLKRRGRPRQPSLTGGKGIGPNEPARFDFSFQNTAIDNPMNTMPYLLGNTSSSGSHANSTLPMSLLFPSPPTNINLMNQFMNLDDQSAHKKQRNSNNDQ